jgi:hypothetical protein
LPLWPRNWAAVAGRVQLREIGLGSLNRESLSIKDRQAILRQGAVTRNRRTRLKDEILDRAAVLEKIAALPVLDAKTRSACHKRLVHLSAKLPQLFYSTSQHEDLKRFRGARRRLVQKLVDIVYDATDNQSAAKGLVEKILRRL